MDQNFTPYSTPFSLYLKAKPDLYSVSRVNTLPTIATAISVVSALVAGVAADRLRNFWIPSITTSIPVLIGIILLVIYNIGENGRLAGFMLTGFEGGMPDFPQNLSLEDNNQNYSNKSPDNELGYYCYGQ